MQGPLKLVRNKLVLLFKHSDMRFFRDFESTYFSGDFRRSSSLKEYKVFIFSPGGCNQFHQKWKTRRGIYQHRVG